MGQGLKGLVGGVTAGVTGVVRAPLQGYNDGTGVIAGELLFHDGQSPHCWLLSAALSVKATSM